MIKLREIRVEGNLVYATISKHEHYKDYENAHIVIDYVNEKVVSCDNDGVPYGDLMMCLHRICRDMSVNKKMPEKTTIMWY